MRIASAKFSPILRLLAVGLVSLTAAVPALARIYEVPPSWGGDIWDRPRATGTIVEVNTAALIPAPNEQVAMR